MKWVNGKSRSGVGRKVGWPNDSSTLDVGMRGRVWLELRAIRQLRDCRRIEARVVDGGREAATSAALYCMHKSVVTLIVVEWWYGRQFHGITVV